MVTGIAGRTEFLRYQLACAGLPAEGEQNEIERGSAAGVRDGIFLEEAHGLTERVFTSLPLHYADPPSQTHDDEVGLHRVVIEVEQQLQEAGGGSKERHLAALQVTLKLIELQPKLAKVHRIPDPPGNPKTLEVDAERTVVADDAI